MMQRSFLLLLSLSLRFLFCLTFLSVSSSSFVLLAPSSSSSSSSYIQIDQHHHQYAASHRILNTRNKAKQDQQIDDEPTINTDNNTNNNKSPLDFIFNPYESKIPKEIQDEIYAAEANTPAAKDRQKRIAGYIVICFLGVLGAFFNAFLSELRMDVSLQEAGFGWVEDSNLLLRFLLLNKIGGGMLLLGGAGAGLLAEAEYDTRRLQAERIFEELQRRRSQSNNKSSSTSKKGTKPKKRRENKRLNALAEIVEPIVDVVEDSKVKPSKDESSSSAPPPAAAAAAAADNQDQQQQQQQQSVHPESAKKKEGLLGTIQTFYERADSMAASQALLLNKKLEDEGLIEKITDETGLKVIGRDAAQKLKEDSDGKGTTDESRKEQASND